jgi:hypothetical protein
MAAPGKFEAWQFTASTAGTRRCAGFSVQGFLYVKGNLVAAPVTKSAPMGDK